MRKKFFMTSLILIIASACSSNFSEKIDIYDDMKRIAAEADSYSYRDKAEIREAGYVSVSFSDFCGKETLFHIRGDESYFLQLTMESSINRGNFKICLVDPEGNVETLLENKKSNIADIRMKKGEYKIVIAGINSSGYVKIIERFIDVQ